MNSRPWAATADVAMCPGFSIKQKRRSNDRLSFGAPAGIELLLRKISRACSKLRRPSALKTCHRHVFLTRRPSQGSNPLGGKQERKKRLPSCDGSLFSFGAPAGIRTPDTLLKRQVLCLLSYWGICGWDGGTRTHYIRVKV